MTVVATKGYGKKLNKKLVRERGKRKILSLSKNTNKKDLSPSSRFNSVEDSVHIR